MSKPNELGLICTECKEVLPADDSIFLIDKDDVKRNVFDFLDKSIGFLISRQLLNKIASVIGLSQLLFDFVPGLISSISSDKIYLMTHFEQYCHLRNCD